MTTLANLNKAMAVGEQITSANDRTARQNIDAVSPYLDFIDLEGEQYAQINEEKFAELYQKAPDKILQILNSSPTATSYKDIVDGTIAKGQIIGMREGPAGITFDIQGKQGIVPKTLGFSNDPEDIVMATDAEGLRGMVNTILQGQSNRLTASRQGYGSRAMGIARNQGVRLSEGLAQFKDAEGNITNQQGQPVDPMSLLSQAESAPEAIEIIEDLSEQGLVEPANAFEMLVKIGSDFNDGLSAYRDSLKDELKDNKKARREARQNIEENPSKWGNMPSDSGFESKFPVLMPVPESAESKTARKDYERLSKEREQISGRLADSQLFFPVGASNEQMMAFVIQNEDLMKNVGTSQDIIDKTRAAFQKYQIAEPEDLARLPDYDSSIDISKSEIASALAVAQGGDNFQRAAQDAYNLLAFGDMDVGTKEVQEFNRTTQKLNMEIDNMAAKTISDIQANKIKEWTEMENKLGEDIVKEVKEFSNIMYLPIEDDADPGLVYKQRLGEAQVMFRNIVSIYDEANRKGLIQPGNKLDNYFRTAAGVAVDALQLAEGDEGWWSRKVGDVPIIGGMFKQDKFESGFGDPLANTRALYEEDSQGNEVFKEIIFVDSNGNRKNASDITATTFNNFFNDATTMGFIKRYITPDVDYSVYD